MAKPPIPSSSRRQTAQWLIAAAGAAVVAAVFALAAAAERAPTAASVTAGCLMLALALGLMAARRLSTPTAFERAAMESARAEPPYAEAMEAIPDPILVVAATERDDVTSRRYLAANLAARRLLRLERSEGLLVSAVRDPEVLDAADAALFENRAAERIYTIAGAQERTLKVMARPARAANADETGVETTRLAILVFATRPRCARSSAPAPISWPTPATNCARRSPRCRASSRPCAGTPRKMSARANGSWGSCRPRPSG
jgi:two-component system phosphate regulon sensor histidine kinase PhoR